MAERELWVQLVVRGDVQDPFRMSISAELSVCELKDAICARAAGSLAGVDSHTLVVHPAEKGKWLTSSTDLATLPPRITAVELPLPAALTAVTVLSAAPAAPAHSSSFALRSHLAGPHTHRAHPWHGIAVGPEPPHVVTAYIEMLQTDTVKFEIDKTSGLLKVDRPQLFSSHLPMMYGFIPRTLCADATAAGYTAAEGRPDGVEFHGDGDALDICVLSERLVQRADVILQAVPVGGLRMIDSGEVDDKIIAVLKADAVYGDAKDIGDLPPKLIDRLRHYFLTYKELPPPACAPSSPIHHERPPKVTIAAVYGADEARRVVERSMQDYNDAAIKVGFGGHH